MIDYVMLYSSHTASRSNDSERPGSSGVSASAVTVHASSCGVSDSNEGRA